jgi:phosphoribosylamine--glycine ligase
MFDSLPAALAALPEFGPPWVIKADGLAAGKGVCVTEERDDAEHFLRECLAERRFGTSGRRVVIEAFLRGEEASVMAVCDGEHFVLLPPARDYKRAGDGDRGPNTGGMGAYAPSTAVPPKLEEEIARRIVGPTLAAMRRRGVPYRGVLYAGLMITPSGPHVIEFNCRFGDPEAQAVLPLVDGSLAGLLSSAASGSLEGTAIRRSSDRVVSVAVVSESYPAAGSGGTIEHLDTLMARDDLMVFHAGTARRDGGWSIEGGRAVHVAARAPTREEARERVYRALEGLSGSGWRYRADIAADSARTGGISQPTQAAGAARGMPWTC